MSYRLSGEAQADVAHALDWSLANFGADAFRRYSKLIRISINDLVEDPNRIGSRELDCNGEAIRLYPIRFSRKKAEVDRVVVKRPRHLIAYRVAGDGQLEILRLLDEQMDVPIQLDGQG